MTDRHDTMAPLPLTDEEQQQVLARLVRLGLIETSKEEGLGHLATLGDTPRT